MPVSAAANLVIKLFDRIKARAIRDNELATMSLVDLQLLAADIGVTETDLREVVPRIGDHSALLDRMLLARGLDPGEVRRAFAGVIRDMEVTCARCRQAGVCTRKLDAGTAAESSHSFCSNAASMDSLLGTGNQD